MADGAHHHTTTTTTPTPPTELPTLQTSSYYPAQPPVDYNNATAAAAAAPFPQAQVMATPAEAAAAAVAAGVASPSLYPTMSTLLSNPTTTTTTSQKQNPRRGGGGGGGDLIDKYIFRILAVVLALLFITSSIGLFLIHKLGETDFLLRLVKVLVILVGLVSTVKKYLGGLFAYIVMGTLFILYDLIRMYYRAQMLITQPDIHGALAIMFVAFVGEIVSLVLAVRCTVILRNSFSSSSSSSKSILLF